MFIKLEKRYSILAAKANKMTLKIAAQIRHQCRKITVLSCCNKILADTTKYGF